MFAYLSGKILNKQERSLVLDVQGVGYLVYSTRGLLEKINEGEELKLYIHTNVREDDISLYGFRAQDEWAFFRLLLSVSGIGPKSALEILNAPMARVKQAIAKRDAAFLTGIQGIGRKTAERIIVDLQGKVKEQILEGDEAVDDVKTNEDVVQALISLGYTRQHVLNGLKKIPAEVEGEEAIIKYFLRST